MLYRKDIFNMKKVLPFLSLIIICLLLTSCGSSSLKGDLTSYSSTDGSFSIELPAENEAEIKPADFITNSEAYEYSLKDGISGIVMFMESDKCYYMYFVMAIDKYFGSNEKIFTESISSLKELTDPDMSKDDTESSGSDK